MACESMSHPASISRPPSGIRALRFESIHDVDETLWDSITSGQGLFHTHRFLRSLENANIEGSRFWYLLLYAGDTLAGAAALSVFTVALDLLMDGFLKRIVRRVRKWFPHFMKARILFCGLPISIGKHSLAWPDPSQRGEIVDRVAREMEALSRRHGIRFLCFKEFPHDDTAWLDRLLRRGFIRAASLPYLRLNLRWKTFPSYLGAMRHSYRRHIRLSLRKIGLSEPRIYAAATIDEIPRQPALVVLAPGLWARFRLYDLYANVMQRAAVKVETLSPAFFEQMRHHMHEDLQVLAFVVGGEVRASAMLSLEQDTMTFLLAGLADSGIDPYDTYRNLLYGIVALAISRGCTRLDLGQAATWVKQCLGGQGEPLFFYLRSENKLLNFFLSAFSRWLFPETTLPSVRVFRRHV
jgi:predicted N-acyltransferase